MFVKNHEGFTLVELIIAITILGLLAVGLLAALDPAEQFAKGRDTSTSQIAQTISGAIERYRATLNNAVPGTFPAGTTTNNSVIGSSPNGQTIINALIAAGELKPNFIAASGGTGAGSELSKIAIMRDVTANGSIYVCYKPTSKAFKMQGGQYYLTSSAATPVGTNAFSGAAQRVSTTAPGTPSIYTGATGVNCQNQATRPTNRDYCAFCYQQ